MNRKQKILQDALAEMVDKIDAVLRSFNYRGEPVIMTLAGGMAVNYYCGVRYTEDVDASFSKKILLPYEDLVVHYRKEDGDDAYIYFDTNYSPALALMHEDYADDLVDYPEINRKERLVKLFLLSPIDLAISKIARFSDQDVEDILALAGRRYFSAEALKERANEALGYYIGNIGPVKNSIDIVCRKVAELQSDLTYGTNIGSD